MISSQMPRYTKIYSNSNINLSTFVLKGWVWERKIHRPIKPFFQFSKIFTMWESWIDLYWTKFIVFNHGETHFEKIMDCYSTWKTYLARLLFLAWLQQPQRKQSNSYFRNWRWTKISAYSKTQWIDQTWDMSCILLIFKAPSSYLLTTMNWYMMRWWNKMGDQESSIVQQKLGVKSSQTF